MTPPDVRPKAQAVAQAGRSYQHPGARGIAREDPLDDQRAHRMPDQDGRAR